MPAVTRSRLEQIRSLANTVLMAMSRGSGRALVAQLAELSSAIEEVNTSLSEVDSMLVNGLRDEALSMHDPELVSISRLLDLRSRPDWIQLYGWLLEHGQTPPPAVNIAAAEQLEQAMEDVEWFRSDMACLRRLSLERASLDQRLAILRRLRRADPAQRVWLDSVAMHEEARSRELRLAIPKAYAAQSIEELAAISNELQADTWDQPPPPDLVQLVAGASEAAELSLAATEAEAIAKRFADLFAEGTSPTPQQIDAAIAQRQRLLELAARSESLLETVVSNPRIHELVRAAAIDKAIAGTLAQADASLAQLDRLAMVQKTRRDFEAACQHLEYLCDHPPESGGESAWLADIQRSDFVARAACQELPDLTIPELLRERTRQAASYVESREMLQRRFWVLTAVAAVAILIAVAAVGGWILWRKTEYARTVAELERRADEARLGLHIEKPSSFEGFASQYPGDPRIAALVEEFDAGVIAETRRIADFNARLADHAERIEELASDVEERRRGGEERWLDAWPTSFVAAATTLAEARQLGGHPENRQGLSSATDRGSDGKQPSIATRRYQQEEDDLAAAEARQADLDHALSQMAQQAFDSRLSGIQDRLAEAMDDEALRVLSAEVRTLRRLATSFTTENAASTPRVPRVPSDAINVLDAIESKLKSLIREGDSPEKDAS